MRILTASVIIAFALVSPVQSGSRTGDISEAHARALKKYGTEISAIIHNRMENVKMRGDVGPTGAPIVAFAIDKQGVVLKSFIRQKSNNELLDDLALKLIPVGYKFPPPPSAIKNDIINFTIPLQFILKN